jgi:hypothetical protein
MPVFAEGRPDQELHHFLEWDGPQQIQSSTYFGASGLRVFTPTDNRACPSGQTGGFVFLQFSWLFIQYKIFHN